jgi:hypothetical protein
MATVRVDTLGTTYNCLWPKILDAIGSLQWQIVRESYTLYQKMAPPLQAEEDGPPT